MRLLICVIPQAHQTQCSASVTTEAHGTKEHLALSMKCYLLPGKNVRYKPVFVSCCGSSHRCPQQPPEIPTWNASVRWERALRLVQALDHLQLLLPPLRLQVQLNAFAFEIINFVLVQKNSLLGQLLILLKLIMILSVSSFNPRRIWCCTGSPICQSLTCAFACPYLKTGRH